MVIEIDKIIEMLKSIIDTVTGIVKNILASFGVSNDEDQ